MERGDSENDYNYLGDDGGIIQFSVQTQYAELLNFPRQCNINICYICLKTSPQLILSVSYVVSY